MSFDVKRISKLILEVLDSEPAIINLAKQMKNATDVYILGRGYITQLPKRVH